MPANKKKATKTPAKEQAQPPAKPPAKPPSRFWYWCKRVMLLALVLLVSCAAYDVYQVLSLRSSDPQTSSFREIREAAGIKTVGFTFVPLEEISPNLIRAVISGEDQRFWDHDGFDVDALQRAMIKNLTEGETVRGGSTISQQLAKNLFLHEGRSYTRKIREAYLTLLLESMLSKQRIMELYLNMIEWGEGVYGAEAASQKYFKHSARALTKDEAAHLAAMIPNPRTMYNPLKNPERHARHKRFILKWMPSMKASPPQEKQAKK
jgi:monofunctional biosynthetic peptidoglycan transglycosylase